MSVKPIVENKETKKRSSNFELLRIVLTLMIIALHYFNRTYGGLLKEVENNSFNYYLSHILESACIIAVNVFIIITGYFSCKKNSIKLHKPINLYALSIFYGIIISGIVIFITKMNIDLSVIKKILTTTFSRWFVVIYCILYLLIPYINKLINSLTKKQFRILLIINTIFFYLWHTFFTTTTVEDGGYGIINFINLYMIGAYIKMYKDEDIAKRKSILVYLACTLITTIYSFFTGRAWAYTTIMNLISSIAIFELFKSVKIKENKFINKLSTYSFSTYIIHENSFFAIILYRGLFHSNEYWNNNLMIVNLIISIVGIYAICVLIEFVRRLIFKRIFDDKIEKVKYEISCE